MQIFKPKLCPAETMTEFHSQEYISFLEKITPENQVGLRCACPRSKEV